SKSSHTKQAWKSSPWACRAEANRRLVVARHAHGELFHACFVCELFEQREMRSRILIKGRDRHQSLDDEAVDLAAARYEGNRLARIDAGLLLFEPGIDLHVEARRLTLLLDLLRQFSGDLLTVDGFDDVEKGQRFLRLVGLQGADQMEFQIGEVLAQRRPFRLRLLHPVLAEDALSRLDDGADVVGPKGLGDGDERDRAGSAAGLFLGTGDVGLYRLKPRNRL